MRRLTIIEVNKLASRHMVKKIAVENFLSTMGTNYDHAICNLAADARSYRWNKQTIRAIEAGIYKALTNPIIYNRLTDYPPSGQKEDLCIA